MTRSGILTQAIDTILSRLGWTAYPVSEWTVTASFFYRTISNITSLANQSAAGEYVYNQREVELAVNARGYVADVPRPPVEPPPETPPVEPLPRPHAPVVPPFKRDKKTPWAWIGAGILLFLVLNE